MSVTLRDFADALNAQLEAAAISTEIAWPNRTFSPVQGVPYLKPECAGQARSPVGCGADGVQQWDGIYQVGVFVPRDSGDRQQSDIASQVLAAFARGLTLLTTNGLRVIISYSTSPAPIAFGDWVNLPVQIHWFATEP